MPNTTCLRVEPLEDRATPSAAGDLDPTFSGDGTTTTAAGQIFDLALAPDGRILAATPNGFVRFDADGDPDPTFAGGQPAPTYGRFAAAPDGGVYFAKLDYTGTVTTITVARYTASGVLDPTFGNGGTATIPQEGIQGGAVAAVLVQPDGRVVVVSDYTGLPLVAGSASAARPYSIVVARLTATGQPDPSFGTNGVGGISDPTGAIRSVRAADATLAPDGRIVVGGSAGTIVTGGYVNYTPAAFRLTAAGQPDPTFGTGGIAKVETNGQISSVGVLPDGRVMLGGVANGDQSKEPYPIFGEAIRLTADGRLDPTYDADGIVFTGALTSARPSVNFYGEAITSAFDAAGRVVFGISGNVFAALYRLTPSGVIDTAFGTNGTASVTSPAPTPAHAGALLVQPNGDILIGGGEVGDTTVGRLNRFVGVATPAGFTTAAANTFVAAGPADGTVQVLTYTDVNTTTLAAPSAYVAGLGQNLRPAVADVTGDGTPDYVFAAGPGGPPRVVVLDGATGRVAADFAPFESTFLGGAFVAAADLDRDGRAEIIVTPDQGGGGRVVVYSVATGGAVTLRASFFGIDDPNFRGGARVAAGDVDRDGTPDVVVAAGFGGGPRVAIFGGASVLAGAPARVTNDFFAFPGPDAERLRNGAYVAAGDLTGDGYADLIFGGGPGGGPRVLVLSGALVNAGNVAGAQAAPVLSFFFGDAAGRGGVRVAARDVDGDGRADLVVGSGSGVPAEARVYTAEEVTRYGIRVTAGYPLFGGAALADGVFVG